MREHDVAKTLERWAKEIRIGQVSVEQFNCSSDFRVDDVDHTMTLKVRMPAHDKNWQMGNAA